MGMAEVQWSTSHDDGSEQLIGWSCRYNDGQSPRRTPERFGHVALLKMTFEGNHTDSLRTAVPGCKHFEESWSPVTKRCQVKQVHAEQPAVTFYRFGRSRQG